MTTVTLILPTPLVEELTDLARACQTAWNNDTPAISALAARIDYTKSADQAAEVISHAMRRGPSGVYDAVEVLACAAHDLSCCGVGEHLRSCDELHRSTEGCCELAAFGLVDEAASGLVVAVAEVLGRSAEQVAALMAGAL